MFHLQAKHTQESCETWGVNGETGTLVDMKELGIWEPLAVKLQTYKTAVEVRHHMLFLSR
jgi:T-complex protein 1 subunit gamma